MTSSLPEYNGLKIETFICISIFTLTILNILSFYKQTLEKHSILLVSAVPAYSRLDKSQKFMNQYYYEAIWYGLKIF